MGEILDRVRAQLGFDPGAMGLRLRSHRMLEGGHTSLQFGRSDDFVDLREYVVGDDYRDIDWRASARSPHLVVRRYVAEKTQEFLLVADTGANLLAAAPSGETKRDLAVLTLGAVGLIACAQSDKVSLVYGDDRGSSVLPGKTGQEHLEQLLTMVNNSEVAVGHNSNILRQLEFVGHDLDKRYAVYIVCDQPNVTAELAAVVSVVRQRNSVHWFLIEDADVLGGPDAAEEVLDVATGAALLTPAVFGSRVLEAFQRAEAARAAQWEAFAAQMGTTYSRISSSRDIGPVLTQLTQGNRHA